MSFYIFDLDTDFHQNAAFNFHTLAIAEWLVVNRLVQTCRFIYKYKGIVTTISNILALVVGFVEL